MVKCKKGKCVYKGKFCEPKYLNKKQCECKKSKFPAGGNGGGGGDDGGDNGGDDGGEEGEDGLRHLSAGRTARVPEDVRQDQQEHGGREI